MSDTLAIPRLVTEAGNFQQHLQSRLGREMLIDTAVVTAVSDILNAVKKDGDDALLRYTRQFDRRQVEHMEELLVTPPMMEAALARLSPEAQDALRHAATRIRAYHEKQKSPSWHYIEADGSVLGQRVTPLDRVGVYVPGGKASYPSSMLMLAIPAQVAGVGEIIAVVPTPYDLDNADTCLVFAAAALAGVSRLYTIGGAQAIGALAFGTQSIPRVDKIAGPGNIYVTVAKKLVFGEVGIDMVAGPSELTVIADGSVNPDWIAMDLFSQAEHDEQAQSILIAPDAAYLDQVQASMARLLPEMPRCDIIRTSLMQRGLLIQSRDLADAARVSDAIAPEHLQLSVADPDALLPLIHHAGAVFLGAHTAEALGDYCAGPSHVLPTSGTARFFSALGVYDFQKRSSVIHCSAAGAEVLARTASVLARRESLVAHARSAEYRLRDGE